MFEIGEIIDKDRPLPVQDRDFRCKTPVQDFSVVHWAYQCAFQTTTINLLMYHRQVTAKYYFTFIKNDYVPGTEIYTDISFHGLTFPDTQLIYR
jgi:hypothetical protein